MFVFSAMPPCSPSSCSPCPCPSFWGKNVSGMLLNHVDMRSSIIPCQIHFTLSRFVLTTEKGLGFDGAPSSRQASCQPRVDLNMIPSAERHTSIIIRSADRLTLQMNQQMQAAALVPASPLLGQSRACAPTTAVTLVMCSQKGAIESKEWAVLLEHT